MIFILGVLILNVCCAANTLAIDFFCILLTLLTSTPSKTSNLLPINSHAPSLSSSAYSPDSTAHSVIKSFSTGFHSDELIDCFHKSCLSILDIRGLPKSRE